MSQSTVESGEASIKLLGRKSTIDSLSKAHREVVIKAISNVLSTEIAELTYAQIVDGLPLGDTVDDVYGNNIMFYDHPVFMHKKLKDGVLDTVRSFGTNFNPQILEFDTSLLQALQTGSPGSRLFNTRLIEVIAVSVHQIAILLYKNNPDLGLSAESAIKEVHTWIPPKDTSSPWSTWWRFNPDGPPPTLFNHSWYRASAQYPDGVADIVGYWAESRILGGVVLFNRTATESITNESNGNDLSNAVYLHPDRDDITYRICQLTDAQKGTLLRFLQSEDPQQGTCPLPILPDGNNLIRVDPEEPFSATGVYRDLWEREMPPPESMGDGRNSCVWNRLDFPTKADQDDALMRWKSRTDRW